MSQQRYASSPNPTNFCALCWMQPCAPAAASQRQTACAGTATHPRLDQMRSRGSGAADVLQAVRSWCSMEVHAIACARATHRVPTQQEISKRQPAGQASERLVLTQHSLAATARCVWPHGDLSPLSRGRPKERSCVACISATESSGSLYAHGEHTPLAARQMR